MQTNPQGRSWTTGEFQAAVGSAVAILGLALGLWHTVDQSSIDIISKLAIQAAEGIGAMITLALIAITIVTKRTDLKTALIEQGLEKDEVVVDPPVIETPVPQVVEPAQVAQG